MPGHSTLACQQGHQWHRRSGFLVTRLLDRQQTLLQLLPSRPQVMGQLLSEAGIAAAGIADAHIAACPAEEWVPSGQVGMLAAGTVHDIESTSADRTVGSAALACWCAS